MSILYVYPAWHLTKSKELFYAYRVRFNLRNKVKPEKKIYAKQLRNNPTIAEVELWRYLCKKQMGIRIKRQNILRGYIADFYAPRAHLVIEVDGEYHQQDKEYDQIRDRALADVGIQTLRFSNDEVLNKTNDVLSCIYETIQDKLMKVNE